MEITVKDLEKSQKEIKIIITSEEMKPFLNKARKRLSKNLNIDGFREGKIPSNVIDSKLGKDKIWQEAATEAIEDIYFKAIKEKNIKPIGRPKVDILKLVADNDFEFKARIPVMPNIELPDYKSISREVLKKEKKEVKVEDKEIGDALKWLQKSRAPKEENNKEAELPEIDDEFAKNIGKFKNLEELKNNLREGMRQEKEEKEKQALRLKILEEINKKINISVSEILIEQELNKMQEEFSSQISSMNMTIEKYLKNVKKSLEEVREGWRKQAEERIVTSIILNLIAEKEGIEISEKEVEDEANKYLLHFKNKAKAEEHISSEQLRAYISGIIRNEKVFEFLTEDEGGVYS